MKIGIIGCGVTGQATHNMLDKHEVYVYDPYKGYNDFDSVSKTEAVFINVPTKTLRYGQSLEAIEDNLNRLVSCGYKGLVIIRSTITPKNMKVVLDEFDLDICHMPEFLDSYKPYYKHAKFLIGVQNIYQSNKIKEIFGLKGYGDSEIRTTSPIGAAMCKYLHNLNGVCQVTFFHIMNDICDTEGVSYREILDCTMAMTDHINPTYTRIAADGKKGFGGTCFPDNVSAFAHDYNNEMFQACISHNKKWRNNGL
jgi:UDP-glucose 6-dehydrogenase